jgi:hypothetical protein
MPAPRRDVGLGTDASCPTRTAAALCVAEQWYRGERLRWPVVLLAGSPASGGRRAVEIHPELVTSTEAEAWASLPFGRSEASSAGASSGASMLAEVCGAAGAGSSAGSSGSGSSSTQGPVQRLAALALQSPLRLPFHNYLPAPAVGKRSDCAEGRHRLCWFEADT